MLLQFVRYGLRPKDLISSTVRHHGSKDTINGDGISATDHSHCRQVRMSSDDNLSSAPPLGLRMVTGTGPAVTPHPCGGGFVRWHRNRVHYSTRRFQGFCSPPAATERLLHLGLQVQRA